MQSYKKAVSYVGISCVFFDLGSVCLPFPWWAASRQIGGGLSSANVCWEKKSEDHYTA